MLSWSTLVPRSESTSDNGIWTRILTCACGSRSPLTTFMIRTRLRRTSTSAQPSQPCGLPSRATMPLSLPMARQARARPIPWRASSTPRVTPSAASCLAQWKRSSASFRCRALRTPHSWSELRTSRFTTRSYPTSLR